MTKFVVSQTFLNTFVVYFYWGAIMEYGQIFKEYRVERKLSQRDLAQATGISQQAISFWEQDKRTPNMDDCIKLADFYGITLDELVGRSLKKNW